MRISRAVHYYYSDPSPLLDKRGGPVGLDEHGGSMAKYCELTEEHRRIVQGRCTIENRENYYQQSMGAATDDSTSPETEDYNEGSPTYLEID